jgi:hypothetical protein
VRACGTREEGRGATPGNYVVCVIRRLVAAATGFGMRRSSGLVSRVSSPRGCQGSRAGPGRDMSANGTAADAQLRNKLDAALVPDPSTGRTRLACLYREATAIRPGAILFEISKLTAPRVKPSSKRLRTPSLPGPV